MEKVVVGLRRVAVLVAVGLTILLAVWNPVITGPKPAASASSEAPLEGRGVTEVEDLLCVRSGDAVEISWRTPTPTSYQAYLEWFNCQGRDGSPVILEDPAKQLEHTLTLTAPGPGACGWGYIVPSGATQPLAPVGLAIGPAAEELDGASFTDLGPQEASCEVPEFGTAAIADPGEPDSWSRPRPFRPDGPPATGCFQADYDTDYFALAVSSSSYPTEVEFEGCPAQVRLVPYEAPGYSLWLSGPRASASYWVPAGTHPFSLTNWGPASVEEYRVSAYTINFNPDPYEPNSFAQPTPWPLGEDTVVAYIQVNGDTDYYTIDLEAGKTIYPEIPDSYLLGAVTISWRSGSLWYSRDLRSGPFVAPLTTRYIVTVGPRSYGYYGITASCAHVPYVLRLRGLQPNAPTVTLPTEGSFTAPLGLLVKWSYEPEGGPAQVGYRVQVDRTTAFDAPVIDVSAASPDAFCSLDLPACGDYCVRVKVQTGSATWTGWSSAVWFRTGLIRILSFPETYDATQLGPDTDARFTVLQTLACEVQFKVLDSKTRVVYRETLREPPGTITFAWPGVIVRSAECPINFAAQLATPGHYFLVAAATLEGYPGLIDGTQVEFVVTW